MVHSCRIENASICSLLPCAPLCVCGCGICLDPQHSPFPERIDNRILIDRFGWHCVRDSPLLPETLSDARHFAGKCVPSVWSIIFGNPFLLVPETIFFIRDLGRVVTGGAKIGNMHCRNGQKLWINCICCKKENRSNQFHSAVGRWFVLLGAACRIDALSYADLMLDECVCVCPSHPKPFSRLTDNFSAKVRCGEIL